MYCLCRYVLKNRTSPKIDQYFLLLIWYWVPSICLILINTSVICLDQGPLGTTWSVRPPQLTHVLSTVLWSTFPHHDESSKSTLFIWLCSWEYGGNWGLGSEFEFIPITTRHTAVFLAGHLACVPVCTYQYTSPAAAWRGCWKPGQSPQVGLALGSGMWSLHKIWESPYTDVFPTQFKVGNSFHCHCISGYHKAAVICTCHDSSAAVLPQIVTITLLEFRWVANEMHTQFEFTWKTV